MFFFEMEEWRKYMKELGIQQAVEHLQAKGLPAQWPTKVADPNDSSTFFLQKGKPYNKSNCPCYEGYYLDGLFGAVKCSGTGELLPGIVWDKVCSKNFNICPYFKKNADTKMEE